MKTSFFSVLILTMLLATGAWANRIFIPMDANGQANHLKAYGIAYKAIQQGIKVSWLLNYKGGSYAMEKDNGIAQLCKERGVTYYLLTEKQYAKIEKEITGPLYKGAVVKLEKAPKIAVYTPLNKEPWDDAVTLALTYAGIPFDKIYASEVLAGALDKYDWVHLHHEDFTGQYGKFYGAYRNAAWYQDDKKTMEALAEKNGFQKVSAMQLAVVKKIRDFVAAGGNMFAMCSATDSYDIALAADGVDICPAEFDGDPMDPLAQKKLDFSKTFAFKDFKTSVYPEQYMLSTIDNTHFRTVIQADDNFTLVSQPVTPDPVPAMLCQNHATTIKGFMGQTTAFRKETLKPSVMVLGEYWPANEARYIHGEYGKGTWTFYGGHDPEAYSHRIGDAPTDLGKFPNSPGYRLILNNVLCPAAKRQVVPTVFIGESQPAAKPASTETTSQLTADRIKMYPNPANDQLIVSIIKASDTETNSTKIQQIILLDIAGAEVYNHVFNADKASVDMNNLVPGMYMVKVNGDYIGKVVKE